MKQEYIDTVTQLSKHSERWGGLWPKPLETAFYFHGHLYCVMPLGFRAGIHALQQLGVDREPDTGKMVFVETATGNAAGCF